VIFGMGWIGIEEIGRLMFTNASTNGMKRPSESFSEGRFI